MSGGLFLKVFEIDIIYDAYVSVNVSVDVDVDVGLKVAKKLKKTKRHICGFLKNLRMFIGLNKLTKLNRLLTTVFENNRIRIDPCRLDQCHLYRCYLYYWSTGGWISFATC